MYKDYLQTKDEDFHIENILKFNYLTNSIFTLMNKTANEAMHFWTEIKMNRSGKKIYEGALTISKYVYMMKSNYNELIHDVKFVNTQFLALYADFLHKILYDELEKENITEKIKELREKQKRDKYIQHNEHFESLVIM